MALRPLLQFEGDEYIREMLEIFEKKTVSVAKFGFTLVLIPSSETQI